MTQAADASYVMPLVSVVIPCYNVAPYVAAAVESALDQTWPTVEVIAVNDGATDGTLEVLERVARTRQDARLRIVSQTNGGLSAARNTGIRCARGSYIGFLDGDDIWVPGKVARQLAVLLAEPAVGLTFSFSRYLTEAGGDTGRVLTTRTLKPTLQDMVRQNRCGNGSTVIARRKCFEIAGVFDTALKSCEDYELWCRILSQTTYVAHGVPQALTCYRLRESSLMSDSYKFTRNADMAMERVRKYANGVPERVLRQGHAMHYRIAAWRAMMAGHDATACELMARAFVLWPPQIVTDSRAAVVLAAMLVPRRSRERLLALANSAYHRCVRLAHRLGSTPSGV
jgi:glycosyltransferase involved in cell wall biosynthesis